MTRALGALVAVLLLVSCLPKQEELQAPVIQRYRHLDRGEDLRQVGISFVSPNASWTKVVHGNTDIHYGRIPPSPATASRIRNNLALLDGATARFRFPPTVQIRDHGPVFEDLVLQAVQILNSALPNDFQIRFDPDPYYSSRNAPSLGTIRIEMAPNAAWVRPWIAPHDPDWEGMAVSDSGWSQIFLDTEALQGATDEARLRLVVHEMLHSMGMDGHYIQESDDISLMTPLFDPHPENADNILFAVDFENLRAMYDPESLGDWNRERYQVQGCMDFVCFGVSGVMGDAIPWANGWTPSTDLADNPTLFGTATWRGRLLGLTPTDRVVAGAAALTVSLDHMGGILGLTRLESWSAGRTPGRVGSGIQWGDGDLHYGIHVQGNEFTQTGHGDDGLVTGIFAGHSHQAMAGVLERDDLAAGFGGKR